MAFIVCGHDNNPEILSFEEFQEREDYYYNSLEIDLREWDRIDKIMEMV